MYCTNQDAVFMPLGFVSIRTHWRVFGQTFPGKCLGIGLKHVVCVAYGMSPGSYYSELVVSASVHVFIEVFINLAADTPLVKLSHLFPVWHQL